MKSTVKITEVLIPGDNEKIAKSNARAYSKLHDIELNIGSCVFKYTKIGGGNMYGFKVKSN